MRQMPLEQRNKFLVIKTFNAFRFDQAAYLSADEDYGDDEVTISAGDILDADLEVWHGKRWKGVPIVVFWREMLQCYTPETTFVKSTEAK